ncbi:hypothetical protein ILUMI_02326 [Ignelater luminosus]|uniref:PiggyBac transposable element-derived protein domain-containing protein n=1 Tax=Ignelater luminosus TaxID=2038154 RepID=A0A8K0DIF7_IGNLU|nr:hypothetical protein ILUMI_02326 [Ignelater luminosus]
MVVRRLSNIFIIIQEKEEDDIYEELADEQNRQNGGTLQGKKAGKRKQYIKNKPRKLNLKIFVRAGVSGLIYNFLLYGREDTFRYHTFPENEEDLGLGAKVLALCKSIPNPACSVVYFDNFFTSLELFKVLGEDYGISALVTITFSQVVCNKNNAYPLGHRNRYNKDSKERVSVPCPEIIKHYNAHMGGVDVADMLVALYRTELKGHRWYLPLVSQIIDICINNAWVLYKRDLLDKTPRRLIICLKQFRFSIHQSLTKFGPDKKKGDSENRAPLNVIRNPTELRLNADGEKIART